MKIQLPPQRPSTYLDANASHPLLQSVREALARALVDDDSRLANASSIHRRGQRAKQELAEFRETLCTYLGRPDGDEFVFCSGATEAINQVIRGFERERREAGRKPVVVASAVEHSAVLDTIRDLMGASFVLPVNASGQLMREELFQRLRELLAEPEVDVLICLQACNNETGVSFDFDNILPALFSEFAPRSVGRSSKRAGPQRVFILLDAAQALGKLDESLLRRQLHFSDYASLSAHKIGGPAGVGALWMRKGVPFRPLITGGVQERKRRAGTANALGLFGFHVALKTWIESGESFRAEMARLRSLLVRELQSIEGLHIHGLSASNELPQLANTLNFHVEGCPEESLLLALDLEGFCVSSGSACNSGSLRPSHVLKAMGYSDEIALSSVRVSLGAETTEDEVRCFADAVKKLVAQVRSARAYSHAIFGEPMLEARVE